MIVPMANSALEAEQVVTSVFYPPKGRRGVGLARAQGYGASFDRYLVWVNREVVVIVQVEHIEAVNNLESILSVEGVDGFIIGPYDLSGSLGIPGQFDHPLMKEAMGRIETVGAASGKAPGIHVIEPKPDELKSRIEQGVSLCGV